MNRPDDMPAERARAEERDVRRLLTNVGVGQPPTPAERERVANTMWAAVELATLETDQAAGAEQSITILATQRSDVVSERRDRSRPQRPSTRLLLWAAILVVALGVAGLLADVIGDSGSPAGPPEANRTTLQVGDTGVSFDVLNNYEFERLSPDLVMFTAGPYSPRGHRRILIAQAAIAFDGQDPETFFSGANLDADPVRTPSGSTAWLVSIGNDDGCAIGDDCVVVAELDDGTPLYVAAGSYSRIEVYDNGDRAPIVVISEAGAPANGPALIGVELTP